MIISSNGNEEFFNGHSLQRWCLRAPYHGRRRKCGSGFLERWWHRWWRTRRQVGSNSLEMSYSDAYVDRMIVLGDVTHICERMDGGSELFLGRSLLNLKPPSGPWHECVFKSLSSFVGQHCVCCLFHPNPATFCCHRHRLASPAPQNHSCQSKSEKRRRGRIKYLHNPVLGNWKYDVPLHTKPSSPAAHTITKSLIGN